MAELEEKRRENKQIDVTADVPRIAEPGLREGYVPGDNPVVPKAVDDNFSDAFLRRRCPYSSSGPPCQAMNFQPSSVRTRTSVYRPLLVSMSPSLSLVPLVYR